LFQTRWLRLSNSVGGYFNSGDVTESFQGQEGFAFVLKDEVLKDEVLKDEMSFAIRGMAHATLKEILLQLRVKFF
jgi:hypothetical protein